MTNALLLEPGFMASDKQPTTLTARVATELMDMAHVICAHAKGANNRPLKLTALVDMVLRPAFTSMHEEIMSRIEKDRNAHLTPEELLDAFLRRLNTMQGHKPRSRKASE